ncbi:MAG: PH domain-containing protein [Anaerolineae bacterium]|nr:PH domain-containing protein [Anaerolineae bacterium]
MSPLLVRPHMRYVLKLLAFAVVAGLLVVPLIMSVFGLIPALLLEAAWLLPLLVGLLAYFLSIRYELGPEAVIVATGLFSRQERRIPYYALGEVRVAQAPLDALLGLASVELHLVNGQEVLVGLTDAPRVCYLIEARRRSARRPPLPLSLTGDDMPGL